MNTKTNLLEVYRLLIQTVIERGNTNGMDETRDLEAQLARDTELFALTMERLVDMRAAAAKALLMARVRNIEECKDHLRLLQDIISEVLNELQDTVMKGSDNA